PGDAAEAGKAAAQAAARPATRPAQYRGQGRDHDSRPVRKARLFVLRAAQERRRQEQGRGARALVGEVEEFARAEFALEQPVFEGRHRDPALDDLTVQSAGGGAAVGILALALAHDDAEIRAADSDRGDRHAQPEIAAGAAADQARDGACAAFQQAEESGLMATLRVGILVDDEIRIGAYPDQARIGEDDEHLAVAAGMDLIARLDGGAAGEPQDLA